MTSDDDTDIPADDSPDGSEESGDASDGSEEASTDNDTEHAGPDVTGTEDADQADATDGAGETTDADGAAEASDGEAALDDADVTAIKYDGPTITADGDTDRIESDQVTPAGDDGDAAEDSGVDMFDFTSPDSEGGSLQQIPPAEELMMEPREPSADIVELPSEAQSVLTDVKEHFAMAESPDDIAGAPSEAFIESGFFDFSYLEDYREVERKWVNKPYAYVSILSSEEHDEYRYHVSEPVLDEFEQYVLDYLVKILRNHLMYQDIEEGDDREAIFRQEVERVVEQNAASTVPEGTLRKLLYYLVRDFIYYGPIDPLMHDEQIEDISCDGVGVPVYVYHFEYRDLETNIDFGKRELNSFTLRLAQQAGKHISVSEPLVDGSLPDGSRIQLTFGGDISTRGPNFTIRRFANIPYTPIDLINWNTFTVEQMAYFWLAIENNRSLIFSGGTGSGKTTSMNAVSFFIPENSKIVSIEDTREVTLPHDNWIQSLTRDVVGSQMHGEISMYELLQSSLRQRPEYIIVGEIRTDSRVAFTFFQAIGTGHTAYTTIHADSVQGVLNRLQNDPLNVPIQMIQDLDIISIQKQAFVDGQRVRRNDRVTEILPPKQEEEFARASDVFEWDPDADAISQVNDSHILQEIADERGWSRSHLAKEINEREEVLRYLLDNDISGYHEVSSTLWLFAKNRNYLMEKIHSEELDVSDLAADISFEGTT